ncbi:MAG: DUF418 domain-containing protein [Novosphingobium sp.]
MPDDPPTSRIDALDFLRGVAVLGILAINITGFWGPSLATFSPAIPAPVSGTPDPVAQGWFGFAFVVFEGKMRALFSLLFGASMVLFSEAAARRGAHPALAQVRRLVWLALLGYLHFTLLWWGDILFAYALCGMAVLPLMRLAPVQLLGIALPFFLLAQGSAALLAVPGIMAEQAVLAGRGASADVAEQAAMMARIAASVAQDIAVLDAGFAEAARLKLAHSATQPFSTTLSTFAETAPLMLIGMALLRMAREAGLFGPRGIRPLALAAAGAITLGAVPTVIAWRWLDTHGWPPRAMFAAIEHGMAVPHLLMALGYAAGLAALYPLVRKTGLARRLTAAGRCAFTNYIGTSALMLAIFAGWGLSLGPELPRAWLPAFVLLGWAAMLAWPRWWLARFGQGPLEALWRRLALSR